ncbi:FAD-binding oxidoreductase [Flavobacterium cupreum]|uniref:D-lactate dehydrogenase (cytochrome) n=2 Tax=Flavobacterium TaxID=237 RepID=A0A4Y7UDK6_9FLAO|nr:MULTISPECIES: FAD-binding and (Fe-S)-binding domain-containing protein [Flavobacterium]RUT67987.1 FAD-binding oxidoreductase [Flavobacterium cupreum]TCN59013.1 D-lactate dehydrogenase [Flavobacterium circumlabens]TEB44414.1 FAD-binding oxidoreductase [Flavobacterium circumlabens]
MLSGNYKILHNKLVSTIDKDRIFHDSLSLLAYGTDASFYRLIPKIVIKAKDEQEVVFILKHSSALGLAVTFRAAGTSLSGQAVTDSVLVVAGQHWKEYEILDNGNAIRLQPGVLGSRANILLEPYNKKIGPDPASINAAMIGGIAANNASGMCCGTAQNTYKTVKSMRLVFADGAILDTANAESRTHFQKLQPDLIKKIQDLAERAKADTILAERISGKYKMKNTTGYSLNALIDYIDPFEIIEHLMIGSEGTLGFISEISLQTVENHKYKAASLMIFQNVESACRVVSLLKRAPVAAVELIDRSGLRSVENDKGVPSYLKDLDPEACALLVDTRASSSEDLQLQIQAVLNIVKEQSMELPALFTDDPAEYALLWKIRKGLFPSVGAMRQKGTTVIIEDVAFKTEQLAEATLELQKLFAKWRYTEAVIFGHALEGNLHFVFTQNFDSQNEIDRYANFMDDVADLVVKKFDGSLKAEHGTGRNMAPYVEMEWGKEAYGLMKEIKAIFDPKNLLNPGVILNDDPQIHLKNLKPIPSCNPIIDPCIECGFCEPNCVSADYTLSPRHRITVNREISRLVASGQNPAELQLLLDNFQYKADDTCATDGLCALSCPVHIDTGAFVKELRNQRIGKEFRIASWISLHLSFTTFLLRKILLVVRFFQLLLGNKLMSGISSFLRFISQGRIPQWNRFMPGGAKRLKSLESQVASQRKVVYYPSCINRTMGVSSEDYSQEQLSDKIVQLLHKGGFEVIYPEHLQTLCCGMPFSSKGYFDIAKQKGNLLELALAKASENGKWPIVCDMSPCLYTMHENAGKLKSSLKIYEPVEFINDILLSFLKITPTSEPVAVFEVCSMKKMGIENKLTELAQKCAEKVIVPQTNCCGFSGDKGFEIPELNASGLLGLSQQLGPDVKRGYSNSRTCEIGLSLHSGISYQSIVYLVDQVSEAI